MNPRPANFSEVGVTAVTKRWRREDCPANFSEIDVTAVTGVSDVQREQG